MASNDNSGFCIPYTVRDTVDKGLGVFTNALICKEGIYRFRSHAHVSEVLSEQGWCIKVDRRLDDDEFYFTGAASPEVLEAWRNRLSFMMPRFLDRFGDEAIGFDSAFLECLTSKEHRSQSQVWFILARKIEKPIVNK